MKSHAPRFLRHRRGMALISVLAVLFLLTLLVVAFTARTTGARAAASNFHANANTRLLADTAVNLVQAQINEATTLDLANGLAQDTWGSQPGAIRVYNNSGSLKSIYRLYSATPTSASSARVDTTANAVTDLASDLPSSSNWTQYGAQWVDVNASTKDSQGRYHFPILDPRDPGADPTASPTTVATLWNPQSGALPLKGFYINTPGTISTTTSPAPMPLRWLYILKDGSIISPDSPATPSNQLTFQNAVNSAGAADIPSVTNPIVGRIAFWTDDESSKININTAAGDDVVRPSTGAATVTGLDTTHYWAAQSIFWATPAFCANDEDNFADFQPYNGEIQRYAGHPGTVGLNSTLSALLGLSSALGYTDFYSLTPRYTAGGSVSSTVEAPRDGSTPASVTLTANRLYPSVGEMIFNAPASASSGTKRPDSVLSTEYGLTETKAAAAVERANFFLTAHSSSSELTLFGTPRVSVWPYTTTYQTPVDKLLAFDSTLARTQSGSAERFYFQRTSPVNYPTDDCNIDGGVDGNIHLFDYLDALTSNTIPGFGGSFSAGDKYPNTGRTPPATRQIIAEIFDYIRTINVIDPVLVAQSTSTTNHTYGQNWGAQNASIIIGGYGGNTTSYRAGNGGMQVIPSANSRVGSGPGVDGWGCQGIGSFPIPVEITVDFVCMGQGQQTTLDQNNNPGPPLPEHWIPYAQYFYPNVACDQVTAPNSYDNITNDFYDPYNPNSPSPQTVPTGWPAWTVPYGGTTANAAPYGGRPSDNSTAMEAFVYVSFVNPAVITSHMQPSFAYSLKGLNNLSVQGYTDPASISKAIYLHFPGNAANVSSATFGGPGSTSDEEFLPVDQSDGGGFINGWIGAWIFGYIPFIGEVGVDNGSSNPGFLAPCQKTWGIANKYTLAPNTNNGNPGVGRAFPFYSQIFGLPGQMNPVLNANSNTTAWSVVNSGSGSPVRTPWTNTSVTNSSTGVIYTASSPNKTGVFIFDGSNSSPLTLTMYSANKDSDTLATSATTEKVATYQFTFPPVTLPLPAYSNLDSQIIGTQPSAIWTNPTSTTVPEQRVTSDRWHSALAPAIPVSNNTNTGIYYYGRAISPWDTVQSLVLSPTWSDVRDLAMYQVSAKAFTTHPLYGSVTQPQAHDLLVDGAEPFAGNINTTNWGQLISGAAYNTTAPTTPNNSAATPASYTRCTTDFYPIVPPVLNGPNNSISGGQGAYTYNGAPGDWDNGVAYYPDGPWVNMPDEGALLTKLGPGVDITSIGYFSTGNVAQKTGVASFFSPNRQIPSPVMFGSLPTGVNATNPHPWQTLLFRPGPGAGGFGKSHWGEKNQPSNGDPPDHLLLDLFWMPQAEPYPISEPFETQGKINLNYEIQPFTYITRDTALRALFAGEEIAVMPDSLASTYKSATYNSCTEALLSSKTGGDDPNGNSRLPVDPDQTLGLNSTAGTDPHSPSGTGAQTGANAWYDSQAKTTRFFRSASEICEMFLVPQGYNWQEFSGATFDAHSWYKIPNGDFALVGDNTREKPYADLYSRVTTKSNTYTVYYTVQSLKNSEPQVNSSGTVAGQQMWDETKGAVVGEYRGSTTIERYLDPNENMPDFLSYGPGSVAPSLEPYYKWRVLSQRQFAP